ncbi:MAG: hypothetical protein KF773_22835 [Deltaproteobacteria bacterium]|nr:hypothetical protein [Deltaproteobacteria bacterium]
MRLGELLVTTGMLTPEQVEQALHAQVMWGGRLGTNLIELGFVDLDTLSQTLGRQHRLPAALARHFEKSDPALQALLSPDLAERYECVPLLRVGPRIALALVQPIDTLGLRRIAAELEVEPECLVPSIAAELRVRYHLERVYQIARSARFLRSRGKTNPPFPHLSIASVPIEESEPGLELPALDVAATQEMPRIALPPITAVADYAPTTVMPVVSYAEEEDSGVHVEVDPASGDGGDDGGGGDGPPEISAEDLDDLSSLAEPLDEPAADDAPRAVSPGGGRDRRKYVRSLTDVPTTDSERQALGRIAIRRVAVNPTGTTLGEATRAIRRGTDRDRVAELAVAALDRFMPGCTAAILLVVRGELAIGWKGFCRQGRVLPEIGVPLDQPSIVQRAIQRTQTVRQPDGELAEIDRLLLRSLGQDEGSATTELGIAPVTIAGRVMCVIAFVADRDTPTSTADSIAAATGAAFARLMRDASR